MTRKRVGFAAVVAIVLTATTVGSVTPAAAWCRWGGCGWGWHGGWRGGWRGPGWGPVAAGVVAGTVVGAAAVAATRPGPYYGYGPGGYSACPPGYHWGPGGRACFAN